MIKRLTQVVFFLPCCIVCGVELFTILLPIWILTGTSPVEREHIFDYLFDKIKSR